MRLLRKEEVSIRSISDNVNKALSSEEPNRESLTFDNNFKQMLIGLLCGDGCLRLAINGKYPQYIHTDKNYIVIHGREEYKIRSTFKDFIKKIKKNDFITISYGILVNMRYVQYINLKEMMVVLENEIQLPLSYKYKNSVKEAYQEYKIR